MSSQESQQAGGTPSAGAHAGQATGQATGHAAGHAAGQATGQAVPGGHNGWATGGVVFAGVLMLCSGVLAILQGIAAISTDDVYARIGRYVYELDLTGWGWLHLILGIIVAVVGWGLLSKASWAWVAGLVVASLSLISQFLFLPYLPLWSVTVMAIDVFIIWALASSRHAKPAAV